MEQQWEEAEKILSWRDMLQGVYITGQTSDKGYDYPVFKFAK